MGTITLMLIIIISLTSAVAFSQKETMAQLQFNAFLVYHRRQFYRVFTNSLVHANWEHLIVNMIVLYSFGTAVEHYFRLYFSRQMSLRRTKAKHLVTRSTRGWLVRFQFSIRRTSPT